MEKKIFDYLIRELKSSLGKNQERIISALEDGRNLAYLVGYSNGLDVALRLLQDEYNELLKDCGDDKKWILKIIWKR